MVGTAQMDRCGKSGSHADVDLASVGPRHRFARTGPPDVAVELQHGASFPL